MLLACTPWPAWARFHPPVPTVASISISESREIKITILHDAIAFALNDTSQRVGDPQMYAFLKGPPEDIAAACADARQRFALGTKIIAAGQQLPIEVVDSPTLAAFQEWMNGHPDLRLPCKMEAVLTAKAPPEASVFTVRFSEVLSDIVVVIDRPGIESSDSLLAPGETSPEIPLGNLATTQIPHAPADSSIPQAEPSASSASTHSATNALDTFWRYTKYGFRHIIPEGIDHAFFVLGLFLLAPSLRSTLVQITAFTVAHTVTLTLAVLHVVGVSSRVVEPIIALSILCIGVENLLVRRVHPWRPVVAFVFGLAHGLGVSTAFNEVGFPPGQLATSLAAFTVGVEGGHLVTLAAAFVLFGWARAKPWYRSRIVIPVSLLIAGVALVWFVQRVWAGWF